MQHRKPNPDQGVFQFKFVSDYFRLEEAKGPILAANLRAKWLSLLQPADLKIAFAMYKGQVSLYGAEYVELISKDAPGWWNHYFFNSWQIEQEKGISGWSVGPNIDLTKPLNAMVPLVVNSNYQKKIVLRNWKHYDPSLISVIPNMVDRTLFSPGERAPEPTVGWIGYDNPSKHTKGVEVIPYLAKHLPHVQFEMIHAVEPRFQHEWMPVQLPNVKIYKKIPHYQMPEIIRRWHVLISGSKWETGATHVKEAMACGIPVIAASTGALQEVATSQVLLQNMTWSHPPATSRPYLWTDLSLQKYAEALNELLVNPDKRRKYSRAAIKESALASPEAISDLWFQFMRKCRHNQFN
ncbi:D-inositol-3-phosphate glycosyltransferase [compost metagenome]